MIQPCFNFKSARYTNKDQILKIGQTLDISDLIPIQFGQKLDIQKFLDLTLVGIGQNIWGKWHL